VKVGEAVPTDEGKNEGRPNRGRYKRRDTIPERIAKDPTEKAWNISGHVKVASRFPRDQKSQAAEEGQQAAQIEDTSPLQSQIIESGQHEVHLDLVGKAPKRTDNADLGDEILHEQQV
jgi:hypothetical protein